MRWTAALLAGSLLLAACTSDSADAAPARVDFRSCDEASCSGEINGAAYEIQMPETWNGTLLLWSHGYRQVRPAPPDFNPTSREAEAAPTDEVATDLLAQGFALAGSAYRSNGWAVADAVADQTALYEYFVEEIGQPERVIIWGASLGGLITQVVAEQAEWVDGAAPMCGAVAGGVDNFDLAMDLAVAVKALFYPELQLSGYDSWDQAVAEWTAAATAIRDSVSDLTSGPAKIRTVAAIVDAPSQTANTDGAGLTSRLTGWAESIATALGFSTFVRYEMEQRVGGNPSSTVGTNYAARISPDEYSQINSLSGGDAEALIAAVQAVPPVVANPTARERLEETGQPTGDLAVPTLTLHTAADPLVIVQNESLFGSRVEEQGASAQFRQFYTVAPRTFTPPAPFGAGHCVFTTSEWSAAPALVDTWLETGAAPSEEQVRAEFGTDTGLNLQFVPPEWPGDAQ